MTRGTVAVGSAERGSAAVEFLGVALVLLVPLVYLVVTVGQVQAAAFAAETAAREAVRAVVTAESSADGAARADAAVRLALADQGLPPTAARLTVECSVWPCLTPGGDVGAAVRVDVPLPFVPPAARDWVPLSVPVEATHVATVDRYARARS